MSTRGQPFKYGGVFVAVSSATTGAVLASLAIVEDAVDVSEIEKTTCDECGEPMKVRQCRTGSTFLGCTAYPKCRNVVNVAVAVGRYCKRFPVVTTPLMSGAVLRSFATG